MRSVQNWTVGPNSKFAVQYWILNFFEIHWHLKYEYQLLCLSLSSPMATQRLLFCFPKINVCEYWNTCGLYEIEKIHVMHGAGDYERNLRKFANFQRQISRKSHRLASTINNETDKLSACSCARPRNPPFIDLPLTIMKSLMPVILTQALCW